MTTTAESDVVQGAGTPWGRRAWDGLRRGARTHWAILAILLVTAVVRVSLAMTSQRGCAGDAATTGLMALHILRDGERPIFCWGAEYNGGTAVTAYVAAAYYTVLGPGELALKLAPITFSLLGIGLVYAVVLVNRERRTAILAALLYASGIPLMAWAFDARGGYPESQPLMALVWLLLTWKCLKERSPWWWTLLLGVAGGFGMYVMALIVPTLVTAGLLLLIRHKLGFFKRHLAPLAVGFVIGWSPALIYSLTHHGVDTHHMMEGDTDLVYWFFWALQSLWTNLTFMLPRMFLSDTAYTFQPRTDWICWVEYYFLVACVAVVLTGLAKPAWQWLGTLYKRKLPVLGDAYRLDAMLVLYVVVFLGIFCIHKDSQKSVRYLLFLEPALSILTALAVDAVLFRYAGRGRRLGVAAMAAGLVAIAFCRVDRYVELAGDSGIQGLRRVKASVDLAPRLIELLDEHGASCVAVEDYDLRMRMNLLTSERIICAAFPGGWTRNPFYEERLAKHPVIPVIVTYDGRKYEEVMRLIAEQKLEVTTYRVEDRVLIFSLPQAELKDWRASYEW